MARPSATSPGLMHTLSDSELEALLADVESELSERKETFGGDAPAKVRQAVCAFANDLPDRRQPGVVFVGARDDGSPSDLPVTDELLRCLADIKTDGNILPPPTLIVEKRVLRGSPMAVMTVLPSDSTPVRHKGRIWVRVGPRRSIATAQDERILNEKRRYRDLPFDSHPVQSAKLDDLDRRRFEEEYLPAAVGPEVLAANERSWEQRLAATKMVASVDDPTPTVVGLLVLGKRPRDFLPGVWIQFLRIDGTRLSDPIRDESVLDGPLAESLRRLEEKLSAHNRTAVDFISGPTEVRRPDYPMVALQQITRNAVMHRTYEATNAPIKILWFDDRIEVMSPGGPFGAVTRENFGQPGVVDYRNPAIAEAMKVLGFVQRYGAGIATARAALQGNGNPDLQFEIEPRWVQCTMRARV